MKWNEHPLISICLRCGTDIGSLASYRITPVQSKYNEREGEKIENGELLFIAVLCLFCPKVLSSKCGIRSENWALFANKNFNPRIIH
ncbi:CLUMA_CG021495, isoform A [Clunio marinus]|uniref:CLUMA_CG021495, isoform A n=1 Tax=Clunio marinus TaxID=568069 RepID=A0A1J1J7M1_9DIPT|nr:CLUMA_CG021495, isoform A [Clunio marinus]